MKGFSISTLAGVLCLFLVANAVADETASVSMKAPDDSVRHYGVYVGLGNPYPTLLGINGAYNLDKDLRFSAGYGQIEVTSGIAVNGSSVSESKTTASTYGVGAEYLFSDWPVRPLLGLHAGYLSVSGDGDISLNSMKKNSAFMYTNAGFDWIAKSGFQAGAGIDVAMLGGSGAGFYINSGYFF
jgi:hypothetical protein